MLKKILPISVYTFIFLLFSFSIFFYSSKKKKNEYENFQKFKEKKTKTTSAYQKRENVQKDLFIANESSRNHIIIKSKNSEVFIDKNTSKAQLKEKLHDIDMIVYDNPQKLFKQIKLIKAKEGIYYFPKQSLDLFDIESFFFNLLEDIEFESLDLNSFFFKASAKKISFYLLEKKPKITFGSLKGIITPEKAAQCKKL